jgi:hypothetical protein
MLKDVAVHLADFEFLMEHHDLEEVSFVFA